MPGYSEKFRLEVISSGVAGYEKQLARAEAGTCPLYRPKGYMKEERRKKKLIKKRSWYKPFSTVLFCPPSPGSQLAKELRKVAEEETRGKGWKVKVIERAGIKLAHQVPVGIQLLCSQHQQVELIMCIEVFLLSDLRVESENV